MAYQKGMGGVAFFTETQDLSLRGEPFRERDSSDLEEE